MNDIQPGARPQLFQTVLQLEVIGVLAESESVTLGGESFFERPAQLIGHSTIRNSKIGAFSYFNGDVGATAFDANIGRFCSIAGVIGPPDHPVDWLSTHPFTFMRPALAARYKRYPDFHRWMPDGSENYRFSRIAETTVGHDCWIGAGAVIKRGVTVGHGAVVGAGAVVLSDVPPYAIVVGSPARMVRLRFNESIVEKLLKLEWWNYDLAAHRRLIDFSRIEQAVSQIEQLKSDGQLEPFDPACFRVVRLAEGYRAEQQPYSLFPVGASKPQDD